MKSHWHCVYDLKYHLVLVTKYRRPCLNPKIRDYLKEVISTLCSRWEVELLEFGGEDDHIHLLLSAHPAMQMSIFINNLKTVTSRMVRKHFSEILSKYYWKPVLWTRAYCLLSVGGASLEVVKRYIEKQGHLS